MQPVVIRTYRGTRNKVIRQFQRDAAFMAGKGYEIESQATMPGRRGSCLGCLTLGIGFLLFPPKDVMTVTYRLRS